MNFLFQCIELLQKAIKLVKFSIKENFIDNKKQVSMNKSLKIQDALKSIEDCLSEII
jgi:hypothetical protein